MAKDSFQNLIRELRDRKTSLENKETSTELLRDMCPPVYQRILENLLKDEEETRNNRNHIT